THFFFSSRRRHTRFSRDWSSDVCSSDLEIRRQSSKKLLLLHLLIPPLPLRQYSLSQPLRKPQLKVLENESILREHWGRCIFLWRSEERRVGKECGSGGSGVNYRREWSWT